MAEGGELVGKIRESLESIIDPELGVDIVNLGLLRSIEIDGRQAKIVYTLTSPTCPLTEYFEREIRDVMNSIEEIADVEIMCTFDPPWTPEDLTDDGRFAFGFP